MEDDEDNDERSEDEEDDDSTMKSYSKKKFFGKTTRDVKPLVMKTNLKLKHTLLKPFKVTFEESVGRIWHPAQSTNTLKIRHKDQYLDVTSKSKFNLSLKNHRHLQSYDMSNTLSVKIKDTTLSLHTKYNSKSEAGAKVSHALKFWQNWKIKYGVEYQFKKEPLCGASLNVERKRAGEVPRWMGFASQYSEVLGLGLNGKFNSSKRRLDLFYKGHMTTNENHKLYFQHKFGYDPSSATPYSNTLTANCQDSLGIGTLNASVTFQNRTIKTKEFRCLIQFQKSLAFGVQRRNDVFEVMMQKSKIKYNWIRLFRINAGNRGLFSSIEGKISLLKTNVDYTLGYKLKAIQNNFYDDSSLGFTFKWNL